MSAHRFRGSLTLRDLPPKPKGQTKVSVTFDYTDGQQLKVTARVSDDIVEETVLQFDKAVKAKTQATSQPIDIVLMLDSSGSMSDQMNVAKSACRKLITEMIDLNVHRLSLMSFDDDSRMFCHLTNNQQALTYGLSQIGVGGCTEMIKALSMAYGELEPSTRKKVALMVTDGYPTDSRQGTISRAQKIRKNGVEMFAIGVGRGFDKNFLDDMVGSKNSYTIDSMAELAEIFEAIVDKITR